MTIRIRSTLQTAVSYNNGLDLNDSVVIRPGDNDFPDSAAGRLRDILDGNEGFEMHRKRGEITFTPLPKTAPGPAPRPDPKHGTAKATLDPKPSTSPTPENPQSSSDTAGAGERASAPAGNGQLTEADAATAKHRDNLIAAFEALDDKAERDAFLSALDDSERAILAEHVKTTT